MAPSLLLYDNECGLCNRIVGKLLQIDRCGRFQFAPIQGSTASVLWPRHGVTSGQMDGLWLVRDFAQPTERLFHRAEAVLEIGHQLGGAYALAAVLACLVPRPLRERAYLWIAHNRYRWFGRVAPQEHPHDARFLP